MTFSCIPSFHYEGLNLLSTPAKQYSIVFFLSSDGKLIDFRLLYKASSSYVENYETKKTTLNTTLKNAIRCRNNVLFVCCSNALRQIGIPIFHS